MSIIYHVISIDIFYLIQRNVTKFLIPFKFLIEQNIRYYFIKHTTNGKPGVLCDITFGSTVVQLMKFPYNYIKKF